MEGEFRGYFEGERERGLSMRRNYIGVLRSFVGGRARMKMWFRARENNVNGKLETVETHQIEIRYGKVHTGKDDEPC